MNKPSEIQIENEKDSTDLLDEALKSPLEQTLRSTAFSQDGSIQLSAIVNTYLNYALQQNHVAVVQAIAIKNSSLENLEDVSVRIWTDVEVIAPYEKQFGDISAGDVRYFRRPKLMMDGKFLSSITEQMTCSLYIAAYSGNTEVVRIGKEVDLYPFDFYPANCPDHILAAFVMPNHPVVTSLLQFAAKQLEEWGYSPSLEGYQSGERGRVLQLAAAAYASIQKLNIVYAEPPKSFSPKGEDEEYDPEKLYGQRVRLADEIMDTHLGTCMDLTLLYASCLEAMGLNPLLIRIKGHIFAGVWLIDESFSDPWNDDSSQIGNRFADGIGQIAVIECTAMCAGKSVSFDEARIDAENTVEKAEEYRNAIDIKRIRESGVRPLPIRRKDAGGYHVERSDRDDKELTAVPSDDVSIIDISHVDNKKKPATRRDQWEKKLLDLNMRNTLINMRYSGVVPVIAVDFSALEDMLAEEEEYELIPYPVEWGLHGINAWRFDTVADVSDYKELIEDAARKHKLHALCGSDLAQMMTKIYRNTKEAMEEKGANTLFLALGLLKWAEGKGKAAKTHFAPIVLIPIDIKRKSASAPYSIKQREEAIVNSTLLEFLHQNFELDIPGLNPPPTDEHGLDIKRILTIVRHAIMNQPQWEVVNTALIGNFSFLQYAMWNDIHNHPDLLNRNKIVRALLTGNVDWDCNVPESVNGEDAYLPVSVDASQLRAINMAANDVSFVLHGPPGTGKSQTITAMIANALTKGKTVLFVAEKMAALEVVQKRLAALGIGDFCLELHSNKAVKRDVLNQLKRGLDLRVWGMSTDYARKIDEIHETRTYLDSYAKELHEKRACGLSLRELIDEYEAIPEQKTNLRLSKNHAEEIVSGDLNVRKKLLQKLVDAGKMVGHPKDNTLAVVGQTEYTQSFRMHLEELLSEYENSIDTLEKSSFVFAEAVDEPVPVSQEQWQEVLGLAYSFGKKDDIPDFLLTGESLDTIFQAPMQYLSLKNQWLNQQNAFLSRYQGSILSVDLNGVATQYEVASKKLFGKTKAIEGVTAELQKHVKYQVVPEMLPAIMAEVEQYRQLSAGYMAAKENMPSYWNAYITDSSTIESLMAIRDNWENQLNGMERFMEIAPKLKASGKYNESMDKARQTTDAALELQKKEASLLDLLKLQRREDPQDWLRGKRELVRLLDSNTNRLRDWVFYRGVQAECEANGLKEICRLYNDGLAHEDVIPVYMKAVYKALIWSIIENEPVLNHFTGNSFNERIKEYKAMEQGFIDLTKQEMFYKLTHNLPTGHESLETMTEMNTLRRAITSGGRGMSIRSLFEQIPHVLPKLCPCLLMSPISVAQYLSADAAPFDIVIFDEASQLPTCKAVGVLARGENAVIVGDPNQMPPTNFFAGNMFDEENTNTEDQDSILDDCLVLGMPEAHLQWHYRSRHESLIAFSNQEYYENSMFTFPSVNDRERRVKLCTVNGVFDRKKGRVNEREGHAVVKEILRRFHNEELSKQSLGVVTFNISQQGLIEDFLAEEYKKDPAFDKWANEREEELFIKNLENVQGDERDVILFSVGYGPDEEGRLSMNFGPLNKEGGWKRLNVAVSRARMEMVVFSSMTADMIDVNRTKARGVLGLRDFLAYAGTGRLTGGVPESTLTAKGITQQICNAIETDGLKTQTDIGHSDFRIDIAVVNPYSQDEYLLGIMLDGLSYGRSKNTKDREISQISVLRGLGWKIHRIWAMDWWDNKDKELETLRNLIEDLKEKARLEAENKKPVDEGPESEPIEYTKKPPKHINRKKKEEAEGNTDFDKFDRFRTKGSKVADKELEEFLKEMEQNGTEEVQE